VPAGIHDFGKTTTCITARFAATLETYSRIGVRPDSVQVPGETLPHCGCPPASLAERKPPSSDKMSAMTEISLSVPAYDPAIGVVAPAEGGTVTVEVVDGSVEIFGDPAGLRDLARMCLALSDPRAPDSAHVHLDAGITRLISVPPPSRLPATRRHRS
jgi:hypothetical protein